jgi:hypothetical protein
MLAITNILHTFLQCIKNAASQQYWKVTKFLQYTTMCEDILLHSILVKLCRYGYIFWDKTIEWKISFSRKESIRSIDRLILSLSGCSFSGVFFLRQWLANMANLSQVVQMVSTVITKLHIILTKGPSFKTVKGVKQTNKTLRHTMSSV